MLGNRRARREHAKYWDGLRLVQNQLSAKHGIASLPIGYAAEASPEKPTSAAPAKQGNGSLGQPETITPYWYHELTPRSQSRTRSRLYVVNSGRQRLFAKQLESLRWYSIATTAHEFGVEPNASSLSSKRENLRELPVRSRVLLILSVKPSLQTPCKGRPIIRQIAASGYLLSLSCYLTRSLRKDRKR